MQILQNNFFNLNMIINGNKKDDNNKKTIYNNKELGGDKL